MANFYVYTSLSPNLDGIEVRLTDTSGGKGNPATVGCPLSVNIAYKTSSSPNTQSTQITIPAGRTGDSFFVVDIVSVVSAIGLPIHCGNDDIYYQYEQGMPDKYVIVTYNGIYLNANLSDSETGGNNTVSGCDITLDYEFILEDSTVISRSLTIPSGSSSATDYYSAHQYQNVTI